MIEVIKKFKEFSDKALLYDNIEEIIEDAITGQDENTSFKKCLELNIKDRSDEIAYSIIEIYDDINGIK